MNKTDIMCALDVKIATLTAWAKIMYDEGKIDLKQYTAMVQKFKNLA